MIRRVGPPPIKDRKYTQRSGAYAILPVRGGVLLTGQQGDWLDIQLPGGGIDPGESPQQTLHREVREETGWAIAQPLRLGAFRRFVYMPEYDMWAEKLCTVFVARPTRRISDPIEPDHVSLVLPWAEAIASIGNDGDRLFLQRYASSSV
ncbi:MULTISPECIES: NUDIX domain-containing protein [Roseobacteraceae]|uniref:RNA pyrophosphohydrolase n=1 Tax=Pseudosulfitobacter pseudonitzschiae TaxID=1402135 RepID=A0A221K4Z1_9RHOB|nr:MULTISPECIES: NUDIX hydrolase [Roseobacteraceae]ASM73943.1 RNA pyrophosphohydrolase [Pseudosulfitobacter pseudonitzschiae]